jgi:hypothetical protein
VKDWIKARRAEFTTKIGLILGALNGAIPAFVSVNPKLTYLGLAVAALLVLFPEQHDA